MPPQRENNAKKGEYCKEGKMRLKGRKDE